jgi:hypothetical protein
MISPKRLLGWLWKVVIVLVAALIAYLVVSVVQVLEASGASQNPQSLGPARAIVVLGAPSAGGKLSADLRARLEQALTIYQAQRAPIVIVPVPSIAASADSSGGPEVLYLEKAGLAPAHIEEVVGTNDYTTLAAVATRLGKCSGCKSGSRSNPVVIIVADPLDDLRLRATASSLGLTPETSPCSPAKKSFFGELGAVWQQASAVAEGRVFGFGDTAWASN